MHGNEKSELTVWDVFNEYADVRDDLENMITLYECLQDDIRLAVDEIADDLEEIQERLQRCDSLFKRYRTVKNAAKA